MFTFGRKKSFLVFNLVYNRFCFSLATKTTKVRNGHFWSIMNEFCVFLIFKGLMKISLDTICTVRKCSPKYFETFIILSFKKILQTGHKIAVFIL